MQRIAAAARPAAAQPVDAAGIPTDPGVLRQTYLRVDQPLSALLNSPRVSSNLMGFTMPVFDGRDLEIEITRHDATGPTSGSVVGRVAGKPGSFVILGYDGPAEAGSVQIPDENYLLSITYAGDGLLRIAELDPKDLPDCGVPPGPPGG